MIIDHIRNAERYFALDPRFARAFAYLRQGDLDKLPPGRHDLDGDNLYALVQDAEPVNREAGILEAHRLYTDIQYTVSGPECIGWRTTDRCICPRQPYDESKDATLFADEPEVWTDVPPEHFVIYFPSDAHAPAREAPVRKVVLKVSID